MAPRGAPGYDRKCRESKKVVVQTCHKKQKWVCRESKFGMEGAKARKIARLWLKHRPKRVCWARKSLRLVPVALAPGAFGGPWKILGESDILIPRS